jgi:GNAT superfamily N-acetyltransferase
VTSLALRDYVAGDLPACLSVFDTNVPRYFRIEERSGYASFLEHLPGPYYLLVDTSGSVVGCGGYAISAGSDVADLCWGMVRRDRHGTGAGRILTELRIERIRGEGRAKAVALRTSQHTAGFYQHLGFRTTGVERDGYGPGLDRVDMRLELRP